MGVTEYTCLLSVCVLIVQYGTVSAEVRCEKKGGIYIYHCPNDTYCCDTVKSGCCQVFFTTGTTIVVALLVILVVVATCTLCFWCIYTHYVIRRWEGTTYTHPAITVIQRDAQSSPQEQTDYCSPPLPLYPPKASYVGTPPPDYQRSTPNPAPNP